MGLPLSQATPACGEPRPRHEPESQDPYVRRLVHCNVIAGARRAVLRRAVRDSRGPGRDRAHDPGPVELADQFTRTIRRCPEQWDAVDPIPWIAGGSA